MDELLKRIDHYLWKRKQKKLPPSIKDWPEKYRIKGIMHNYKRSMGYSFDYNNPVTFTEKLKKYEIEYDREDFPDVVDKYLFKSYIANKIGEGYTIPMYGVWDTIDGLRKAWPSLPNELVLKSTVQGDGKYIKIIRDKQSLDFQSIEKELETWLNPKNTLVNSYCRAYYRAIPRILAEKYMTQIDDQLYDYKLFCFNGKPQYVYVATDHFPGQLSHISFYDLNWTRLDVRYGEHPNCLVEKPNHFEEMLRISKILSEGFPFVRVDFFDTGNELYVAELTLYPGGGLTPYHPEQFNRKLGELFNYPEKY